MASVATKPTTPAASSNAKHVLAKVDNVLRKIGTDEKFSPTVRDLEPGRVEARYAVRPDEKSTDRYEVVTVFDFRNASATEIQNLAIKHCVIATQRNFREMASDKTTLAAAMNAGQWARVNVKTDIVDAARKSADPVARARSAVAKSGLTKAELLAMIAAMPE